MVMKAEKTAKIPDGHKGKRSIGTGSIVRVIMMPECPFHAEVMSLRNTRILCMSQGKQMHDNLLQQVLSLWLTVDTTSTRIVLCIPNQ